MYTSWRCGHARLRALLCATCSGLHSKATTHPPYVKMSCPLMCVTHAHPHGTSVAIENICSPLCMHKHRLNDFKNRDEIIMFDLTQFFTAKACDSNRNFPYGNFFNEALEAW